MPFSYPDRSVFFFIDFNELIPITISCHVFVSIFIPSLIYLFLFLSTSVSISMVLFLSLYFLM